MACRRNKVLSWSSPSRRCSSPAPTASSWRSGFLCEVRVQESSAGVSSFSSLAWRGVFQPFYPRLQRQLGCAGWWEGGSSSTSLRWSWLPSASTDPCRLELGALPRPTVRSALAHPELRLRVSSPAQVKACVRWSSLRFGFEGDGRVCGRRRRQPPASVESASRSFRSRDLFGFSVLSRGLFAFCMGQLFSVSLYGVSVRVLVYTLNL